MENEFWPDSANELFGTKILSSKKSNIIKNQTVKVGTPLQIKTPVRGEPTGHEKNLFPIENNGEIVGFEYACNCGEVVKVMFDFEEQG